MSDKTHIQWTDSTWSPVTGCTRTSEGCTNCYIERTPPFRMAHRRFDGEGVGSTTGVLLHPERLTIPLRWRKPRRIFVCSMADLFHDSVPDEFVARVFAAMALAPQHTFQVLTKRHARLRSLLSSERFESAVFDACEGEFEGYLGLPLSNVWIGVSAENQQWADIRIPALLDTPAAVRFVSAEPLLGPIDLRQSLKLWTPPEDAAWQPVIPPFRPGLGTIGDGPTVTARLEARNVLHWVIVGGESGRGARPMHPRWARDIRDQCQAAGVPFLFKQRGEWTWRDGEDFYPPSKPYTDRVAVMHAAGMTAMTKGNDFNPFERGHPFWATRIERVGKKAAGRELDGRTWDQYPEAR